ncbi:MAG: CoA transferase [Frankiales bacterium]|nr:MAG: CoA transferase [Frankiales bacterium]
MSGPLSGIRVVELAGLGPAPYACMLLADLGAEVLRVDRPSAGFGVPAYDVTGRGRSSIAVDLKHPAAAEVVLRLVDSADVLVEGLRPGVAERLGVGPDACLERNPRLVYARMTGWGQTGPLAPRVGHDINYAAISGALGAIGEHGRKPVPPINLLADFGGGSMFLLTGILAALLERGSSGQGQVVDAAMVDGVTSLLSMTYGFMAAGFWSDERGSNLLDGGAPFYDTYECADGEYVAIGALEPQFWDVVVRTLGLVDPPDQNDRSTWPQLREQLAAAFRSRTRDEWAKVFEPLDACVSPVLKVSEARSHAHLAARESIVEVDGVPQPAPAPRFSRTPGEAGRPSVAGAHTRVALQSWGFDPAEVEQLEAAAVVTQA